MQTWEREWQKLKRRERRSKLLLTVSTSQSLLIHAPMSAEGVPMPSNCTIWPTSRWKKKLKYYDFTSLYPWVNKDGKYPVGHPEIISQPGHTDINQYFGIAKCTVLPPEKLSHPVLPLRQNNKLTFPLCTACVQEEMNKLKKKLLDRSWICTHNDQQRQILGTWCIPE